MHTINFIKSLESSNYNAVVIAVSHAVFQEMQEEIINSLNNPHVIFDLKALFHNDFSDLRL